MLQKQFADIADNMFDEDTAKIVRNHALVGAIVMALPLCGIDWMFFLVNLWHMYAKLSERANKSLCWGHVLVGIFVNIAVAVAIDLLLTFIPAIGWLGTAFVVYLQFYFSGKLYIEALKD